MDIISYTLQKNKGVFYVSYRFRDSDDTVKQRMRSLGIPAEEKNI